MKTSNWNKFFLGFGILTIISGLFLIVEKDYVSGISGTVVGIWLIAMNYITLKNTPQA